MQSLGKMQIIAQPPTSMHTGNIQARSTVGQRRKEAESVKDEGQDSQCGKPSRKNGLPAHTFVGCYEAGGSGESRLAGWIICCLAYRLVGQRLKIENEFNQSTGNKGRCQVSWEVVVKETLTTHQPEGEVMRCPAKEEETGAVVHPRSGTRAPD